MRSSRSAVPGSCSQMAGELFRLQDTTVWGFGLTASRLSMLELLVSSIRKPFDIPAKKGTSLRVRLVM